MKETNTQRATRRTLDWHTYFSDPAERGDFKRRKVTAASWYIMAILLLSVVIWV